MLVALFMAHFPKSILPIQNNGEPAVLFFTSFLVLLAYGSGKWSLGKKLFKKEIL
jgi:putative oxidoreductase